MWSDVLRRHVVRHGCRHWSALSAEFASTSWWAIHDHCRVLRALALLVFLTRVTGRTPASWPPLCTIDMAMCCACALAIRKDLA